MLMLRVSIVIVLAAFQSQVFAQTAPEKIQALIITGQNGHDWRTVSPLLRKALEATGRFEVRITEEFRGAGPETLAPYQVVILNYFDLRNPAMRWGDRADNALLDFVRNGRGVVIYHFSVAAFDGWQEYEKMCGGNWRPNQGHHSAAHDFDVDIVDQEHPITKGFKTKLPQTHDELYANLRWQPEGSFHLLATAYDDHSLYGGKSSQPIPGPGINQPMLWTVQYGQGRVFATVLGHDGPAVQTPTFVATFTRGTEWAATGKVTIPIPPELAK